MAQVLALPLANSLNRSLAKLTFLSFILPSPPGPFRRALGRGLRRNECTYLFGVKAKTILLSTCSRSMTPFNRLFSSTTTMKSRLLVTILRNASLLGALGEIVSRRIPGYSNSFCRLFSLSP